VSSLSVIIPSNGRHTLLRTLDSVMAAGFDADTDEMLIRINNDSPWGHRTRNMLMPLAKGSHLMFMDDDDVYTQKSFEAVRSAIDAHPTRIHVFRMNYMGGFLWKREQIVVGNLSTQMFVVPNISEQLGRWTDRYEGDFDFIKETVSYQGEPIWHTEIIATYRA
jgi:hypothetical protein